MKAGRKSKDRFDIELKDIYEYVCETLAIDIKDSRRTALYVNGRTLFLSIATKTTDASREHLGEWIGRDHSTATFGINRLIDPLMKDEYYKGLFNTYVNLFKAKEIKPREDNSGTLVDALKEINRLKEVVLSMNEIETTIHNSLTENEAIYRTLNDVEMSEYDTRATNVLKSFSWKRKELSRKEVFETINCA